MLHDDAGVMVNEDESSSKTEKDFFFRSDKKRLNLLDEFW